MSAPHYAEPFLDAGSENAGWQCLLCGANESWPAGDAPSVDELDRMCVEHEEVNNGGPA